MPFRIFAERHFFMKESYPKNNVFEKLKYFITLRVSYIITNISKAMKTKVALIAALIIIAHCTLIIENCNAQWVQLTNGIGNDKIIHSVVSSGNNIFAGTSYSGVYLSTNNGDSWTQTTLNDVSVYSLLISGNKIFAGTNGSGLQCSTDNGQSWTRQYTLSIAFIFSLENNGDNIIVATQDYSAPFGVWLSTNNGQNWTLTSLYNITLRSLAMSGNNIFAGSDNNGVYLSTNNGENWTQMGLNNKGVYTLTINGNSIYAGTPWGLYISTNNGQSWNQTALNLSITSFLINGNNFFAGTSGTPGGEVYLSTNNGQNWIQKNQRLTQSFGVYTLLIANNYIFAGTYYSVWRRSFSEIMSIQNISTEVPTGYKLEQNYPNPFNPATTIKFSIPKSTAVKLSVFDITGREVGVLVNEILSSGTYQSEWNAASYSSGVYFYKLQSESYSETKRMILMK